MKNYVLKCIFPSHEFSKKVTKADFMKNEDLKAFYEDHVNETTYFVQIKKCKNRNCKFHLPVRSENSVMDKFVWLPPPKTSETNFEKYEDFSVVIEKMV